MDAVPTLQEGAQVLEGAHSHTQPTPGQLYGHTRGAAGTVRSDSAYGGGAMVGRVLQTMQTPGQLGSLGFLGFLFFERRNESSPGRDDGRLMLQDDRA